MQPVHQRQYSFEYSEGGNTPTLLILNTRRTNPAELPSTQKREATKWTTNVGESFSAFFRARWRAELRLRGLDSSLERTGSNASVIELLLLIRVLTLTTLLREGTHTCTCISKEWLEIRKMHTLTLRWQKCLSMGGFWELANLSLGVVVMTAEYCKRQEMLLALLRL